MRNLIILFALLLSPFTSWAQSYNDLILKAESAYQQKDYEASGKAYEQAFKLSGGNATDLYNAACSWALAENSEKALQNLDESAKAGYRSYDWLLQDTDLQSLHSAKGWTTVVEKVKSNLAEYEKDFDKPLQQKLEEIYVKDQMLRQLIPAVEEKFGRESKEMAYYWTLISQQDSLNEVAVVEIIEKRGWPGKSLVGGKANITVWLVIQHAPLELQEKYLPLLRKSVLKGESEGSHLAMLEDRILMRNGQKQKYGSQIKSDPETGEYFLHPIEDPANINKRRAEVGLGPIEEYVKRWGIKYDPSNRKN